MIWALAVLAAILLALMLRVLWREAAIRRRYPPLGVIVKVNGRRVHALTMGEGRDLVLIHGASGQLRDLMPLMQRLAPLFRVTAFDRPGLGHSEGLGAAGAAPAAQARHLAAAAALLGITAPIVLGQSYGGTVALGWALAVEGPQAPAALVLVSSPALPWPGGLDWWYRLTDSRIGRLLAVPLATALVSDAYLERMMPGLFAPASHPSTYVSETGAALALPRGSLHSNAEQVNALLAHVTAMQADYPRLSLPVELIHGAADRIVPLDIHALPLSTLLPAARLTVLPDAGHMPHHTHLDAVVDATKRAATRAGWTWPPASS